MAYVPGSAAGNSIPVGSTLAVTFPVNPSAGHTIVAFIGRDNGVTVVSLVDTLLNNYVLQDPQNDVGHGEEGESYVAKCPVGGANTLTITFSGPPGDGTIIVALFSGRNTTTPVTDHNHNQQDTPGTATDGVLFGAITAAAGDDLACFVYDASAIRANNYTAGTGFSEKLEVGSGSGSELDSMFSVKENVSAGAITATATSANNDAAITLIVALALGSGGGASAPGDEAGYIPKQPAEPELATTVFS